MWVPSGWVAAGVADLPGVRVELVTLGPDLGETSFPGPDEIPPSVADVEFYVPSFFPSPAGATVLARMPRLRVVQTVTAGVDWLRPHVPESVALCNARGVHDASTAEWVIAAMLGALHALPVFSAAQAAGRWAYQATDALAAKQVLIVGYGSIGAAVERRLAGFEVSVSRVARGARPGVAPVSDLPLLLPAADVVVLLVPHTAETTRLADAGFLARMKDGALLVNAARGAVVDTGALTAEVASGRLRAALDVTDPEPLPSGHPLWSLPGVFITPHVGGSTPVSQQRAAQLVATQATAYLRGEPLQNVISGAY
jgi:phosphoglycerate dehydrogenase-like enzyme